MARKHLAVASALILLLAASAQAAVRIDNNAAYRQLKNLGGVLAGSMFDINLSVYNNSLIDATVEGASDTIDGGNTISVNDTPAPHTAHSPLPVSLTLNSYDVRYKDTLNLGVSTGGNLNISVRADVGEANRVTTRPQSIDDFSRSLVLSTVTPIPASSMDANGVLLTPLSSKVDISSSIANRNGGLLSSDVTPNVYTTNPRTGVTRMSQRTNLQNVYGTVGSEAAIEAISSAPSNPITMEWRARTTGEAYYNIGANGMSPPADPSLSNAEGQPKWLTSDVVKIGGITDPTSAYALQISFDNRINEALDGGSAAASVAAERNGLYLAEVDSNGKWQRAGALNESAYVAANPSTTQNVDMSLSQFLTTEMAKGLTLKDLLGSWGLDDNDQSASHPFGVSNTGTGFSWAIVAGGGSGIFAVVPEPAELALLISAAMGFAFYGVRRYRKG